MLHLLTLPYMYSDDLSILSCRYPGTVSLQNTYVLETPNPNRPHVSTLEIVVGIQVFPLHQLTSCVKAWALDKIAEDVAIFYWWPLRHIIFKLIVVLLRIRVV